VAQARPEAQGGQGIRRVAAAPEPEDFPPDLLADLAAYDPMADYTRDARVAVLSEIAQPAEQLRFARVALRLGVTREQAFALAAVVRRSAVPGRCPISTRGLDPGAIHRAIARGVGGSAGR